MYKLEKYGPNGELLEVIDTRTLEFAKEDRIRLLKYEGTIYIETNYPDFKQRNAAMGIYDEAENTRIISGVKACIDRIKELEAQINACSTNDEVDTISFTMN
jgi:hypothetical protein